MKNQYLNLDPVLSDRICTELIAKYPDHPEIYRAEYRRARNYLYDFPTDADYLTEFFETVGAVCGVDPKALVLSERHIPDDVVVNADRTQVLIKRRGAESNLPEGVGRRSQWIVVAPTGIGVTHEGRGHEVSGRTPPARRVAVSSRTGGSLQRDGTVAC